MDRFAKFRRYINIGDPIAALGPIDLVSGSVDPITLPEAEPESVAGFITEYSPVISPLILSTEYADIIAVSFRIIIPFLPNYDRLMFFLLFVCLIRTTSNRLKFDELMTNARIVIPPVISSLLLFILMSSSISTANPTAVNIAMNPRLKFDL